MSQEHSYRYAHVKPLLEVSSWNWRIWCLNEECRRKSVWKLKDIDWSMAYGQLRGTDKCATKATFLQFYSQNLLTVETDLLQSSWIGNLQITLNNSTVWRAGRRIGYSKWIDDVISRQRFGSLSADIRVYSPFLPFRIWVNDIIMKNDFTMISMWILWSSI